MYVYPEKRTYKDRLTLQDIWVKDEGQGIMGGGILPRDSEPGHPISVERVIT